MYTNQGNIQVISDELNQLSSSHIPALLYDAADTAFEWKSIKRANRCTTNWRIYNIKYSETAASREKVHSWLPPLSAKSILPNQGSLSASSCFVQLTEAAQTDLREEHGGASQQQKGAKPRTASSVVLLSHSSLGFPLGTGLEEEDRPLTTNWHHQLKSHFHPAGHTACRLLWNKLDRRLPNERTHQNLCVFTCVRTNHHLFASVSDLMWADLFSLSHLKTGWFSFLHTEDQKLPKGQKCSDQSHLFRFTRCTDRTNGWSGLLTLSIT